MLRPLIRTGINEYTGWDLVIGKPREITRRIFLKDDVQRAVEQYMNSSTLRYGELCNDYVERTHISMDMISHSVTNLAIDTSGNVDLLMVTIKPCATPYGKLLQSFLDAKADMIINVRLFGKETDQKHVIDIQILAIDVMCKPFDGGR